MSTLKTVLNDIRKELVSKEKIRNTAQQHMRKTTSLSKQAILFIHQKRFREARELLKKAKSNIERTTQMALNYAELVYSGLFNDALQEYSEACLLFRLVQESKFATPEEIEVPSINYVLALGDVIGELRRLALDALREGDVEKGEDYLKRMDEIYVELMAMDESYMFVSGLRRKCDIARRVIEATRGDVTQEIRRNKLEQRLEQVEKSLERKNKHCET